VVAGQRRLGWGGCCLEVVGRGRLLPGGGRPREVMAGQWRPAVGGNGGLVATELRRRGGQAWR
jgi:hypothetical protein